MPDCERNVLLSVDRGDPFMTLDLSSQWISAKDGKHSLISLCALISDSDPLFATIRAYSVSVRITSCVLKLDGQKSIFCARVQNAPPSSNDQEFLIKGKDTRNWKQQQQQPPPPPPRNAVKETGLHWRARIWSRVSHLEQTIFKHISCSRSLNLIVITWFLFKMKPRNKTGYLRLLVMQVK